jgi:hypothetical protein
VHFAEVLQSEQGKRATHVRVNYFPDGGVARLRVWGDVARDFATEVHVVSCGGGGGVWRRCMGCVWVQPNVIVITTHRHHHHHCHHQHLSSSPLTTTTTTTTNH